MPCVYYSFKVQREYEETIMTKDSEGNTSRRTERRSEVIASNQQSKPFYLQDDTGKVQIDPAEAAIETVQVLSKFRSDAPVSGMLRMGDFSLTLGDNARRTLGYRYTESVLPANRQILVVGEVSDRTGRLSISRPQARDKKYIISLKTDESLAASAARNAHCALIAMIVCLTLGTVLIVIGMIL
ncbi:MAG: hypothetical protein HC886_11690 [Leptolyngbyaceae cyanobacterium SM1_1_3]|nr:hypothetical protein [Leptolyngbyaceae cyanobacterium SM1_1_3]